jgi:hypothetical protein
MMGFNPTFATFFLLFFAVKWVVDRKIHGLDLILVCLVATFLVLPGGLLSNGLGMVYLIFFFVFGARERIPFSMAAFALAYAGVYCASLVQATLPAPVVVLFLAAFAVATYFVQCGKVFFDIRSKEFQPSRGGRDFYVRFAHLEYFVFRAFAGLLILYMLVPFFRHRLNLPQFY